VYQNLSLSQGFNTPRWNFSVTDAISYLPYTASTGLSGIPGAGDVGVSTGTDANQQVLTTAAARVGNTASGTLSRNLDGRTSLSGNGSYSIQRFVNDSNAIKTDSLGGGGSLSRRLDARTSLSGSYYYNQFSFVNDPGAFTSQGITVTYGRTLTRRLNLSVGGGPALIGGSSSTGRNSTLTYSADVRVTYSGGVASAAALTASYVRSANGGSGASFGSETDTYSLSGSRRITRSFQPSGQLTFTRNSGLYVAGSPPLVTETIVASVQANRALSRVISAYGSYTAQHQTFVGSSQGINPLNGLSQTLAFGVTYSPRSIHVGRQ
jgi:hypothetical protein